MLSDFIAEVKNRGLANPNKFKVNIALPQLIDMVPNDHKMVQMFCDQAQLPDLNISTSQSRTYGEVREVPYENLYGNITMSFYVDSNFIVKDFFDRWIMSISNQTTRHFNYYNEYISPSIDIIILNNAQSAVYGVKLLECYPKQLQAVSLDYASKDIVKLSVSMNYKYWRSTAISDQVVAGENQLISLLKGGTIAPTNEVREELQQQSNDVPIDYFQDFYGYQNRVFGDFQNIETGNGDSFGINGDSFRINLQDIISV
jgi:hypothetical protein